MSQPEFGSIRQTAAKFPFISETLLRRLVKEQRCPGFYSGRKFVVNQTRLLQVLTEAGVGGCKQ